MSYIDDVYQRITRKAIEDELKRFSKIGEQKYLAEASKLLTNATGIGAKPSRTYFIVYRSSLYPMKAIARMALLSMASKGDKKANYNYNAQTFSEALNRHNFEIRHNELQNPEIDTQNKIEWLRRLSRKGQIAFRAQTLKLWGGRCCISGVSERAALEAAHVQPHAESGSMKASNSILLRADLHILFDLNVIAIDPASSRLKLSCGVTDYSEFEGKKIKIPKGGPKMSAFQKRWDDHLKMDAK